MKKTGTKQPLPKLAIRTLDHRELSNVTGGLPPRDGSGTNGTTYCICCEDGLIDGDPWGG